MAHEVVAVAEDISIHALHEESDASRHATYMLMTVFQSTLSMRRATGKSAESVRADWISIHALHEESDGANQVIAETRHISIHALHEESDQAFRVGSGLCEFQSTLSMRRATQLTHTGFGTKTISIHALHEESDEQYDGDYADYAINFNPRSP